MGLKALMVSVFKSTGMPFILATKTLTVKVKALILGVLKSRSRHVDAFVGTDAVILMCRFALPRFISPVRARELELDEDEQTKRTLLFSGYTSIIFWVSSLGFRSIRLWYFGVPFWDFSTHHEEEGTLPAVKALMVSVFKSTGRPFILATKTLTVKVKALILGVLKSGSPHVDGFVGTDAVILMYRFALPRFISSDGAHEPDEYEETVRTLILSGYSWIVLLVSSLGFRSIRLWYFGVPFWDFSTHHEEEGTLPAVKALMVSVFKSTGRPFILATKTLTVKVKALILGVLKSGSPHVDGFVGTDAVILMCRFALPRFISPVGARELDEHEQAKRMLLFSGYTSIIFWVSSLGFRSIRLWYFGVPFWDFSTHHEEEGTLPAVKALMVSVFKSTGRPFILATKTLTVKVKALILGVLKSGSPHVDGFVGTDAVILMYRFALPRFISSDGAHEPDEYEETVRTLILCYSWIVLLVSSIGFRSIRLWYFGVPFWDFSTHHEEEGTLPEELVALKHGDSNVIEV